jgi:signal peptidase
MYCAKCGTENKDDAVLCSKCGKEISDKAEILAGRNVRVSPVSKKPSNWWYVLPLFLGLIGGIIGYFALRNKNKAAARNMLIIGLVTVAIVPVAMAISYHLFGLTRGITVGSGSMLPHIQIGDIIFIQSVDRKEIITYQTGRQTNYSSFGDYGDVILYNPRGREGSAPLLHRAMYYVNQDEPMWPGGPLAPHAGYITKGDNNRTNAAYDQQGSISPSNPVKKEWVIGVAWVGRPWLGCVSLILRGNYVCFK